MVHLLKVNFLVLVWLISSTSLATVDLSLVPSVDLIKTIPGSSRESVEDIPDQTHLNFFFNNLLLNSPMNLPGWNNQTKNQPNLAEIYHAFAVRTTIDPSKILPNNSIFYSGKGVGRSGVWELEEPGQYFAKIDGRPLKGLTIKGYGGNKAQSRGQQAEGSMDAPEAYRDMLLSKILMEQGVPSYLGAFAIVRPTSQKSLNANYIRLSRSSLRMNDIIDRSGEPLKSTVDHLSKLVGEELGHTPNVQEFANWLVTATAETLALKEHARVKASNTNKDNLGIAEIVDFGEASYDPINYKPGTTDIFGVNAYSPGLSKHVIDAANKIATEYSFTIDASALFNKSYEAKFAELKDADAQRVNLDSADESQLFRLGLSQATIDVILEMQKTKPFGILTVSEVAKNVKNVATAQEMVILKKQATTSFLRLNSEVIISEILLDEVGGADGLRDIMVRAMINNPGQDAAKLKVESKNQVKIKMTALKTNVYVNHGNFGSPIDEISSILIGNKVNADVQKAYSTAKFFENFYMGVRCQNVFAM